MSADIERPSRPRLTFPYWLALILFLITLASAIVLGGQFVLSPDYRDHRLIYGGVTVAIALLIWLWILGSTRRFRKRDFTGPIQTVRGGLAYLRWLLAYFQGNVTLVAAAYNAGEGAVNRYRGMPPYPETRAYVRRVQRLFAGERHPYDSGLVLPSPILAHSNATR